MGYPLIILGAGASFDYSAHTGRPPLTEHLVSSEHLSRDLLERYEGAAQLISEVGAIMQHQGMAFEEGLRSIRQGTGSLQFRKLQLVDLQFYLRDLFARISKKSYHPINNYQILVSKIRATGGKACVVSFNYDTLFEQALGRGLFKRIRDYVSPDIKIIKPHGSHDWAYIMKRASSILMGGDFDNSRDLCRANPDYLESLHGQDGGHPYHVEEIADIAGEVLDLPAIAMPLPDKHSFVCPTAHIDLLKGELPKIDRVLIIGWAAGDSAMIEIMEQNITQSVPIAVVTGQGGAAGIKERLSGIRGANFSIESIGFGSFVGSTESATFFGV